MARRLAKQIGPDIEQLRWLWWQTVRRYPRYRKDVAALLRCWRRSLPENTQGLVVRLESGAYKLSAKFFQRQARGRATEAALAAYRQACSFTCPDVSPDRKTGKLPTKFFQADVELTSIIQRGVRSRYYTVPHKGRRKLTNISNTVVAVRAAASLKSQSVKQDALPELTRFNQQWGLQFPIPPSVGLPLEELMTSGWCWPVEIVRGNRESLTLILHPSAGREIVLAFIEGALHHFSPKRKHGKKMAWKMASRKRGVKRDVRIVPLSKQRRKLTIALPANAQDVRAALADKLPRSESKWRDHDVYETVFTVIDSLKTDSPRPVTPSGRSKVWESQRAFKALVRIFGLPR
jgi:hypothetical protein